MSGIWSSLRSNRILPLLAGLYHFIHLKILPGWMLWESLSEEMAIFRSHLPCLLGGQSLWTTAGLSAGWADEQENHSPMPVFLPLQLTFPTNVRAENSRYKYFIFPFPHLGFLLLPHSSCNKENFIIYELFRNTTLITRFPALLAHSSRHYRSELNGWILFTHH